jgi:hypothetical protein
MACEASFFAPFGLILCFMYPGPCEASLLGNMCLRGFSAAVSAALHAV